MGNGLRAGAGGRLRGNGRFVGAARRLWAIALAAATIGGAAGAGPSAGPFQEEAGTYVGLAASSPAYFKETGLFQVRVSASGAVSGWLQLWKNRYPVRGVLDGAGSVTDLVLEKKDAPVVTLGLALDTGAGEEGIHGQAATVGPPPSALLGLRRLYTAKKNPAPPLRSLPPEASGVYGLRFDPEGITFEGNAPLLPSYATMTVSPSGKVKVAGELPDGTILRSRAALSLDGTVPFFVLLYLKGGSVSGHIPLPSGDGEASTSGNPWFRPRMDGDPRFPSGWPHSVSVGITVTRGAPVLRTLLVQKSGDGAGSVGSSPGGIDFGAVASHRFPEGTVVTLTATAEPDSTFDGWSGAGAGDTTRVVTMDADAVVTAAFRSAPFTVDIDLVTGLITFPNPWSGWQVGGGSLTNYVAYPAGWSVGGGSATNFVALPPGWSVGGAPQTNYTAVPPGWSVGGGSATNFVAVPPGWSVGGTSSSEFVAVPPGWTAGGGSLTNFTALPPGWTLGGGSATNYVSIPPGWSVGGAPQTNYFGYPTGKGWTTGGAVQTNLTALPPGWSTGGAPQTNYVAVPPGWLVGGGSATEFITYPGPSVTTIELKFDDPGWLGCFQVLRDSGAYTPRKLADIIMAAFLNLRKTGHLRGRLTEATSGDW